MIQSTTQEGRLTNVSYAVLFFYYYYLQSKYGICSKKIVYILQALWICWCSKLGTKKTLLTPFSLPDLLTLLLTVPVSRHT